MNIENLVRKNILNLMPYTSARESNLDGILLDANENAFGSAIELDEIINRYPDPNHRVLRKTLGEYLDRNPENIFFGVGSDEIIDLLIRVFCEPRTDSVLFTAPSYGMYKVACDVNDVTGIEVDLNDSFDVDKQEILENLKDNTKIIFLCSPNNPTGNLLSEDSIRAICSYSKAIVVVDEAYIDFCPTGSVENLLEEFNNLVILRTFSKAWGMAGIRCGYCLADETIIDLLYRIKAPYNLNVIVQKTIYNAIKNSDKKDRLVTEIIEERNRVAAVLSQIDGVKYIYKSDANFLLFEVDDPVYIYNCLLGKGIVIRDRSSMRKLEGCLRVTIGTHEENNLFLREVRNCL